jgi:hydrogenase expression/formation protein HypD
VSVIIGAQVYGPIVEKYGQPCVITGFEEVHMIAGLARLVELVADGKVELVNEYAQAVSADGNPIALKVLDEIFEPADVRWRGLSVIPESGLVLREKYRAFDAQQRFGLQTPPDQEPRGCLCGQVITGLVTPHDCTLFGTVCTPINPIGPCMVSSEGTCQAWFKYHRTRAEDRGPEAQAVSAKTNSEPTPQTTEARG